MEANKSGSSSCRVNITETNRVLPECSLDDEFFSHRTKMLERLGLERGRRSCPAALYRLKIATKGHIVLGFRGREIPNGLFLYQIGE